jgi:beta-lactamase class D
LKLFFLLFSISLFAYAWEENPKICALFAKEKMQGTFLLYDVKKEKFVGCDEVRARTRYTPASTFKIANSLIGLWSGAVEDVDTVLPYTGDANPFMQSWKRDMGLREAIAMSNVPIYQELARRIGLKRMQEGVAKLDYGNQDIGTKVDRFWLDGPLQISAMEQVLFLAKLADNSLPFSKNILQSVREILLLEEKSGMKLYGKTGWQNAPHEGVGWFVGWVESKGEIYAFALNLDMHQASDAPKRVSFCTFLNTKAKSETAKR